MGAKRIKSDKKTGEAKTMPKETPEQGLMGFRDWLEAHQQKLTLVVASIFVLLLVGWGVSAYLDRRERSAQSEYAAILKEWPSDDGADTKVWEGLRARLERFIVESGGCRAALYAQMDLMRILVQEKRVDEAVRLAGGLADKVSTEQEVGPLLRYQLALTYDVAGKPDEALAQWTGLKGAPLPGVEREVDWRLGRIHAARQDFAKAADLFESALKHSGDYPSATLLQQDLAAVKPKVVKGS